MEKDCWAVHNLEVTGRTEGRAGRDLRRGKFHVHFVAKTPMHILSGVNCIGLSNDVIFSCIFNLQI